jgi:HEAT repeat protein
MDPHRLLKACSLRLLGQALLITSDTYAYMLFLSSYPQNWIPYLYFSLAFFAFVSMQLIEPFLKKDLQKFARTMLIVIIGLSSLFLFLLGFPAHWIPFIFAIFIITAVVISNTTDWILVTALFNMREFKAVSKWVSLSTTLGAILAGLLIPLLLKFFPAIILLYLMIAFFMATFLIALSLRIPFEKPEPANRHRAPMRLHKEGLYIYTFLSSVIILILFIFADYSMKSELTRLFDKKEIGQFLAPFFAITSALIILVQTIAMPPVLRRFGVVGLIMICPLIYIVGAIFQFMAPSLWTATFLSGIAVVLRYSYYMMGNRMIFNVYPPAVRNVAKYQVESIARSLGIALGAVFLIVFTYFGGLRLIALAILLSACIMIYIVYQLGKSYFSTLKSSINMHRFATDYLSTEKSDEQLVLQVASQALSEKNEETQLFGLSLFRKLKLKRVPPIVIEALSSEYDTVQNLAIRVMNNSDDSSVVPFLMKQLSQEKNPETIWFLVEAIARFSPNFLLSYASNGISSDDPAIKAAAISIFLKAGDAEHLKTAEQELASLVNHPDPRYRYWAVYVLRTGALSQPGDYIFELMNDNDAKVSRKAFYAASLYPDDKIILSLIDKLWCKTLAYRAGNALVAIGSRVIPPLLAHIQGLKNLYEINMAMTVLTKLPSIEAEEALLELLKREEGYLLEKCVISLAYRAKQFQLSENAHAIIYEQLFSEVNKIKNWAVCYCCYTDNDIQVEIGSRIHYARKRYLYLLAAYSEPKIILQIIPTLLSAEHSSRTYVSATELLELCVVDQPLKESIPVALEESRSQPIDMRKIPRLDDPWLMRVIKFKEGGVKEVPLR